MEYQFTTKRKVKEASLKRLHSVSFQLYDILEKSNRNKKEINGCQVLGVSIGY